jgi:glycosyltransferase involved in cell wall biosynthesis
MLTIVGRDIASLETQIKGHWFLKYFWPKTGDNLTLKPSMPIDDLRHLQKTSGVHLCPSSREGFGHYINEARAMSAFIMTTDYGPMNGFVDDGVSGILNMHSGNHVEDYQLLPPAVPVQVKVKPNDICKGVERILAMNIVKRAELGANARRAYEEDTKEMRANMEWIRADTLELFYGRTVARDEEMELYDGLGMQLLVSIQSNDQ